MHHAKCMLYAAVSHVVDLSGNKCDISEGSKSRIPEVIGGFGSILFVSIFRCLSARSLCCVFFRPDTLLSQCISSFIIF